MNVRVSARNHRPERPNRSAANPISFMFHYPACVVSGPSDTPPVCPLDSTLPAQDCNSVPLLAFRCLFLLAIAGNASSLPSTALHCLRQSATSSSTPLVTVGIHSTSLYCRPFPSGARHCLSLPTLRFFEKTLPRRVTTGRSRGLYL
jgi:hypothetical protein